MDGGCDRLAAMVDGSDEILSFSHVMYVMDRQQEVKEILLGFTWAADFGERWCSILTKLKEKDDGVICIGKYSGLQTTVPTEDLPASFSTVEGLGE